MDEAFSHNAQAWRPSRRAVLVGAAALALNVGARGRARAASLSLGDGDITILSDGNLVQPASFMLPDTPEAEARPFLESNGMAWGSFAPDCNVTFLRRGDRFAVFDAGSGANFMDTAGKLGAAMADAGIDTAAVTDVIFTHGHPDHLWGVLDDFDELVFAKAQYRMAEAEFAYWSAADTLSTTPDERKNFVTGAQTRLDSIGERIAFFKPGEEVFPGVEAIDTSGHTPGHVSFMLHGSGEPVIVTGDALTNQVISFMKPDWPIGPDQDRAKGVATRRALLDRLAADRARIIGYHLPHPGTGRVERRGDAYAFVADA